MFVIKIKNHNLFYNNRNNHGFHSDINKADLYNTIKGAKVALSALKYWWEVGIKDSKWRREYHSYIKNFNEDIEIKEVEVKLKD